MSLTARMVVLMAEAYQRGADLLNCPAYCAHKQRTYIGDELYFCTVAPKGGCPREHHSLMEAVCEAADDSDTFFKSVNRCQENHCDNCPEVAICRMMDTLDVACTALNTYRKERGLL